MAHRKSRPPRGTLRATRIERFAGVGIALAALMVYAWSAPAWVLGGDNGELVTIMARGGVAHPPGYPLYVMILRSVAWIPANPAHASALVTAVIGAAAVVALHRACKVWGASAGAAAIATATFAASPLMWRLSTEAEVFALNALIALAFVIAAAPGSPVNGWRRAAPVGSPRRARRVEPSLDRAAGAARDLRALAVRARGRAGAMCGWLHRRVHRGAHALRISL